MRNDIGRQLDARLQAYAATVHTPAISNALKRSTEKWSIYAAVTSAALRVHHRSVAKIPRRQRLQLLGDFGPHGRFL